jgi:glycerol-3-phosphate dehydrogenase
MTQDLSPTLHFDLIIIGAGVNGAGIARDASMRGLKVLLVDKGDIAGGTSSFSTRLIHGGLRYLEHGEFGLVRESLRERETLLRIASHLIQPIPILIPIYKNGSRGRLTIRAGMIAYDLLSIGKTLPAHRVLSRADILSEYPGLKSEELVSGVVYYDCRVEFAERLVVENVISAKHHGATVFTYAHVKKIEAGSVEFIRRGSEETEVAEASVVINAAGPWVDQLLSPSGSPRLIGGTKGSHIVVKSFGGAPSTAIYVEAESDRRPIFVIPWNGNYLIGTTDVRFEDDPDQVRSERWEVDYLLKETNRVFPDAKLSLEAVCYTYSGVRPLPFTDNEDRRSITRRHFIRQHSENSKLLSIVGGKLTTYRSLAENCVDLVFEKLGNQSPACLTGQIALPGAVELVDLNNQPFLDSTIPATVLKRLALVYGSKARAVLELCREQPELAHTFNKDQDALAAEVVYAFKAEFAQTLADCLLRRTMLGLNADLAIGDDEAAAAIGKKFLGWSEQRARGEVSGYREFVKSTRRLTDNRDSTTKARRH